MDEVFAHQVRPAKRAKIKRRAVGCEVYRPQSSQRFYERDNQGTIGTLWENSDGKDTRH